MVEIENDYFQIPFQAKTGRKRDGSREFLTWESALFATSILAKSEAITPPPPSVASS